MGWTQPQTVVGSGGVPLDAAAAAARLPEGFYHPDDSANEATDGAPGSGPAAAAVSGSDAAAGSGLDAAAGSGSDAAARAPNGEGEHAHPHDAPMDVMAAPNDVHDDEGDDDGDGDGDGDDDDDDDDEGWITPSQRADSAHAHQHEAQMDVTTNGGDVADDDEGWITPSNVAAMRAKNRAAAAGTPAETPAPGVVACITSDFAMQVRPHQGGGLGEGRKAAAGMAVDGGRARCGGSRFASRPPLRPNPRHGMTLTCTRTLPLCIRPFRTCSCRSASACWVWTASSSARCGRMFSDATPVSSTWAAGERAREKGWFRKGTGRGAGAGERHARALTTPLFSSRVPRPIRLKGPPRT